MERYRREGETYCIDIRFHDFNQLYDNRDPAPFRERDLDEDLVKYLMISMDEIPRGQPIKIVLQGSFMESDLKAKEDFVEAFHQFFHHEVWAIENELKQLLRLGRTSLFFGMTFLIICVLLATNLIGNKTFLQNVFNEGLIIMGWVAIWRPINIFLYEWWPHLGKRQVYKYLSKVKIEFK
jgi:hypothetical protein